MFCCTTQVNFISVFGFFNIIVDSTHWRIHFNSLDGLVVRVSASGAVDLGLIPNQVKPVTLKLVFRASRDSVKNKPATLLVPLGKALSGIPHLGVVERWMATPKRARIVH